MHSETTVVPANSYLQPEDMRVVDQDTWQDDSPVRRGNLLDASETVSRHPFILAAPMPRCPVCGSSMRVGQPNRRANPPEQQK